jgi:hypothetical protein
MPPAAHPLVGPALSYFTSTAVGDPSSATLQLGVSFGPGISIGIGVDVEYNRVLKGAGTIVRTAQPQLRIVYAF